jgi:hypothetical protein
MSNQFDTQTYENDTFACEIHMHACRFLNISLLRQTIFLEHIPKCDFNTHECDLCMKSMILTRSSVIFTRSSVISTRRMRSIHDQHASIQHACVLKI